MAFITPLLIQGVWHDVTGVLTGASQVGTLMIREPRECRLNGECNGLGQIPGKRSCKVVTA